MQPSAELGLLGAEWDGTHPTYRGVEAADGLEHGGAKGHVSSDRACAPAPRSLTAVRGGNDPEVLVRDPGGLPGFPGCDRMTAYDECLLALKAGEDCLEPPLGRFGVV